MLISSSAAAQDGIKVIINTNLPVWPTGNNSHVHFNRYFKKHTGKGGLFTLLLETAWCLNKRELSHCSLFTVLPLFWKVIQAGIEQTNSLEKPKRGKTDSLGDFGKNQILNFISCFRTKHD